MDQIARNSAVEFPLALRQDSPAQPLCVNAEAWLKSSDGDVETPIQHAQVRPRGERRRNHLRRWLFRGMDELRRQQANAPAPEIGRRLDESL